MKRPISDITAIELEGVTKYIFPSAFDNNLVWRFNHDSVAKVIQYYTLKMEYEFLITYSDNSLSFHYIKQEQELKIKPGEYHAVETQLKQLGFDVPKIEL